MVRFGIIGLGVIANRFARVLATVENTALEAVAARSMDRAQEFAQRHNAERAYGSYDELIKDENVNIIYIALTHNFHHEAIKKCLLEGKAVICEKPLVTNAKDARELIELSREKNVLLMEAMWSRCLPVFEKARQWGKEGRIGEISLIEASFSSNVPFMPEHRLFRSDLAGGSLYDVGSYPIEFTLGILDEAPVSCKAVGTLCESGVDDLVLMSLKFKSGALAALSCGLRANTSNDAVIYGTKGKIVVLDYIRSKRCELYDEKGTLKEVFEDEFDDGFIYQIRHVCGLYKSGRIESELVPHKDTLACADIVDMALGEIGGTIG